MLLKCACSYNKSFMFFRACGDDDDVVVHDDDNDDDVDAVMDLVRFWQMETKPSCMFQLTPTRGQIWRILRYF